MIMKIVPKWWQDSDDDDEKVMADKIVMMKTAMTRWQNMSIDDDEVKTTWRWSDDDNDDVITMTWLIRRWLSNDTMHGDDEEVMSMHVTTTTMTNEVMPMMVK